MKIFKNIYTKVTQIVEFIFYNGLVILMIIAAFSFGQSVVNGVEPTIAGYKPIYILTGSMQTDDPARTIDEKSIIISELIEHEDLESIKVGDVVTYRNYDTTQGRELNITHRVIEVDQDNGTFVAKGDANRTEDWFDTEDGQSRDIPLSNIKYRVVWRWNWVAVIANLALYNPKALALYAVSLLSLLFLLKLIHKSIYTEEYEIKLFSKRKKSKEAEQSKEVEVNHTAVITDDQEYFEPKWTEIDENDEVSGDLGTAENDNVDEIKNHEDSEKSVIKRL